MKNLIWKFISWLLGPQSSELFEDKVRQMKLNDWYARILRGGPIRSLSLPIRTANQPVIYSSIAAEEANMVEKFLEERRIRMEELGRWDANPYYEPEKCGLKLIGTIDDHNMCYEYDTICVWQDVLSGKLYMAQDSGCSCPTPFEAFYSLGDLTPCPDMNSFSSFVGQHDYSNHYDVGDIIELRNKLFELLP